MTWRWFRLGSALLLACVPTGGPEPPTAPPVVGAADTSPAEPLETPPLRPVDPPRLLTDPGSGISVVWAGAAVATAVAGAELVVVEPDLRHLGAYDWSDGKPRWRIELPVSATTQIYGLADRVLLHDGGQATVVEAASGRVLGRHPAPPALGPSGPAPQRLRNACAWVGPCGIQAFDCSDGAPIGRSFAPPEPTTECTAPRLLGRVDQIIVMVAPLSTDSGAGAVDPAMTMIGLVAGTGEIRWEHALIDGTELAGVTLDGACWVLEPRGRRLQLLEPDTGVLRWERSIGPGKLDVYPFEGGLVVAREHGERWRLSTYASNDGKPLWSTRLLRRQLPSYPEGIIPDASATGARRTYALIDPSAGAVLGELVAGRDETLWRDPAGGFVLTGRDLREVADDGRLTRQRPFSGLHVQAVTSTHVLTHQEDAIGVFDRDQLRERARLEGRLTIDATASLPDGRLLLVRDGDDGVALLLGLEPWSRGGRRD